VNPVATIELAVHVAVHTGIDIMAEGLTLDMGMGVAVHMAAIVPVVRR
jgi:hypothetical protein